MPALNANKPVLISEILSQTSNPTVKRMSVMSSIERKALEEKLITLRDLRKFINLSMREAESAIDDHKMATLGYNIARSVSIACTIALTVLPMTVAAGTTATATVATSKFAIATISVTHSIAGDIITAFNNGVDESFAVKKLIKNKSGIVALIFEQAGKSTVANGVNIATTIGEIAYDLYKGDSSSSVGIKSSKLTLMAQLQKLDRKIYELEVLISQL